MNALLCRTPGTSPGSSPSYSPAAAGRRLLGSYQVERLGGRRDGPPACRAVDGRRHPAQLDRPIRPQPDRRRAQPLPAFRHALRRHPDRRRSTTRAPSARVLRDRLDPSGLRPATVPDVTLGPQAENLSGSSRSSEIPGTASLLIPADGTHGHGRDRPAPPGVYPGASASSHRPRRGRPRPDWLDPEGLPTSIPGCDRPNGPRRPDGYLGYRGQPASWDDLRGHLDRYLVRRYPGRGLSSLSVRCIGNPW